MAGPATDSVQMYYVSEGVPVGLVGSAQKQEYPGSSAAQLHNGNLGREAYTFPGNGRQQEASRIKRADSLESLLSLNVLAAQLLTDHDDLQSVSSLPESPRNWNHGHSPEPSEAYSGTPNPSHRRFESYSTVSTRAPSTPPPNSHYAEVQFAGDIDTNGGKTPGSEGQINGYDQSTSPHQTIIALQNEISLSAADAALPSDRHFGHSRLGKPLPNKPRESSAPRIASMVIQDALSNAFPEGETSATSDNGDNDIDGTKTPIAEHERALPASSSAFTIRPDNMPAQQKQQTGNLAPASSQEIDDLDPHASDKDRKGKGRAIDQDAVIAPMALNGITQSDWIAQPEDASLLQQSPGPASPASVQQNMPFSPSGRKISELLREQYELRQRSGTLGSASSPKAQGVVRPHRSTSATSPTAESPSPLSPSGHAPISLNSQDSSTSTARSDAQTERAQLLHSIISQDFAGGPTPAARGHSREPSTELPWHPTEYVGPPRRRSISGTSILALGRKSQSNPRSANTHRRQNSADLLTTRTNMTGAESTDGAQRLGISKAFAASADDLLTRKISIQKRSESAIPAQNGFAATTGRMFSIKRKTPPVAPAKEAPSKPTATIPSEAPFRSMLDTTYNYAPPSKGNGPSLGHKRSLSGSIHSMLSSFGSSSHLRRKRNVSAPDTADAVEHQITYASAPQTPSAQSPGLSEFGSYPRQNKTIASSARNGGSSNGRHSPFKMWSYPSAQNGSTRDMQGNGANGPVNSVHITQVQTATVSSPVPSEDFGLRSHSPFFRASPRFQGSSQALSSADTIAEDDGEDEDMYAGSDAGQEEEEDEESRRLKGLASQQVLRDSENRARVVEKFKEAERSASSLGMYTVTAGEN